MLAPNSGTKGFGLVSAKGCHPAENRDIALALCVSEYLDGAW